MNIFKINTAVAVSTGKNRLIARPIPVVPAMIMPWGLINAVTPKSNKSISYQDHCPSPQNIKYSFTEDFHDSPSFHMKQRISTAGERLLPRRSILAYSPYITFEMISSSTSRGCAPKSVSLISPSSIKYKVGVPEISNRSV